jgi:hypothetical protein
MNFTPKGMFVTKKEQPNGVGNLYGWQFDGGRQLLRSTIWDLVALNSATRRLATWWLATW